MAHEDRTPHADGDLAGRHVLVIGGGQDDRGLDEADPPVGNGRAISILAARHGAAVAVTDRVLARAEETVAMIGPHDRPAVALEADASDEAAMTDVFAEAAAAMAEPLTVVSQTDSATFTADYFAEEVRRELSAKYGEAQLYKGGLSVRATLDPRLQKIADPVLRKGLIDYDRSHGWRGPLATIETTGSWEKL